MDPATRRAQRVASGLVCAMATGSSAASSGEAECEPAGSSASGAAGEPQIEVLCEAPSLTAEAVLYEHKIRQDLEQEAANAGTRRHKPRWSTEQHGSCAVYRDGLEECDVAWHGRTTVAQANEAAATCGYPYAAWYVGGVTLHLRSRGGPFGVPASTVGLRGVELERFAAPKS